MSVGISGSYLLCLWSMSWPGYRTWHYVNSMNCSVRSGVGSLVLVSSWVLRGCILCRVLLDIGIVKWGIDILGFGCWLLYVPTFESA